MMPLLFPCYGRSMAQIGRCVCVCVYTWASSLYGPTDIRAQMTKLVKENEREAERWLPTHLRFSRLTVSPFPAVHCCSTVVIFVIIYDYSGRGRKIVSSHDIGAV